MTSELAPSGIAVETTMNEEIQAVYIGDKSPQEALASAQQRAEEFAKYI